MAARTMSCSSSGSSGSMASGAMVIDLTTRSPETLTVTIPPPAEASTSSCLSCSCAASMSACIFWTCLSICCMFGGCGIRAALRLVGLRIVGDDLLGVELRLEACHELVLGGRLGLGSLLELAQLEDHAQRAAGQAAQRVVDRGAVLAAVGHLAVEGVVLGEGDDDLAAAHLDRVRLGEAGGEQAVVGAHGVEDGGPQRADGVEVGLVGASGRVGVAVAARRPAAPARALAPWMAAREGWVPARAVSAARGGVGRAAAAARAAGAGAPAPASAASRRSTRAISARAAGSTSGAAALTSAASRRVRASAPSLTVRRASASRSSRRTRLEPGTREACSARRSSRSGVRRSSGGHLAQRLHDEQVARVGLEVLEELGDVAAGVGQARGGQPRGAGVAGGHGVEGLEEQVRVGDAEHGEDVLGGDVGARVGHELLERAERVAEGAGGVAREQGDGVGRDLDRLGGGHARDDDRRSARPSGARSRSGGSGRRPSAAPSGPRSWRGRRSCPAAAPRAS